MKRAFTIIELLVAISIIGILIAAASLSFSRALRSGRDAQRLNDAYSLAKTVDQYATTTGGSIPKITTSQFPSDDSTAGRFYVDHLSTTGLALSNFRNSALPKDPSPAKPMRSTIQIGSIYGYVFDTEYGHLSSDYACITSYAVCQGTTYTIEILLENPKSDDNKSLKVLYNNHPMGIRPSAADSTDGYDIDTGRYEYLVNGTLCNLNTTLYSASSPYDKSLDRCYN